MRKYVTGIFLLFISSFLFSYDIEYRVVEDCIGYPPYENMEKEKIKKNTVIVNDNIGTYGYNGVIVGEWPEDDQDYIVTVIETNKHIEVPVAFVELSKCKTKLPESILTFSADKLIKKAIPAYFLDVLHSNSRETLCKYELLDYLYKIEYVSGLLNLDNLFFARVTNIGICLHSFCDEIDFINIKKISETEYECEGFIIGKPDNAYECFSWHSINYASTPVGETETVTLKIDGDYLHIYNKTKNKPITTLAYVDDSVMEELVELFKNNSCDQSKVKWPHHADGSCDYDGNKKKENESKLAPFMRLFVKENLKLRAEENTSSPVLTVMKPGVEVRILEVGKAETIDGINSNWVKVDVQFNPRGNTGEPLTPSMTGWCYGGYLE